LLSAVMGTDILEGLITPNGDEVIPAEYERIGWCRDQKHFFCCSDGQCEMYLIDDIVI
jgi:hypothetical protein